LGGSGRPDYQRKKKKRVAASRWSPLARKGRQKRGARGRCSPKPPEKGPRYRVAPLGSTPRNDSPTPKGGKTSYLQSISSENSGRCPPLEIFKIKVTSIVPKTTKLKKQGPFYKNVCQGRVFGLRPTGAQKRNRDRLCRRISKGKSQMLRCDWPKALHERTGGKVPHGTQNWDTKSRLYSRHKEVRGGEGLAPYGPGGIEHQDVRQEQTREKRKSEGTAR